MAGRRRRLTRDALAGITPLRGRPAEPAGKPEPLLRALPSAPAPAPEKPKRAKPSAKARAEARAERERRRDAAMEPGRYNPGQPGGKSGIGPDGTWTPVSPRQRPPFAPGNEMRLVYGASRTSPDRPRQEERIRPRAAVILAALVGDPQMPDHIRSPAFRDAVEAYARAQAMSEAVWLWATGTVEDAGIAAMMYPQMPGTKPAIESWRSIEAFATAQRSKLGLDPVSYAKIAKDLGIAQNASEAALHKLAGQGADLVARRAAGDAPA